MSILRVLTPATATLLTTPQAVVDRMGEGDPASPAVIQAVASASSAIAGYCQGRVFGREQVLETFRGPAPARNRWPYTSHGHGQQGFTAIGLGRRPIYSIDSVAENGTALDPAEYELDPGPGLLHRLTADGQYSPWSGGVLAVTWNSGWKLPGETGRDLPYRYEEAAILTAVGILTSAGRDPNLRAIQTDGVGSYTFSTGDKAPDLIPLMAQSLLEDLMPLGVTG